MKGLSSKLSHIPPSAFIRVFVLLGVIGTVLVLTTSTPLQEYLSEDQLAKLMDEFRQVWWAPVLLIGLYLITPFGMPAGPLLVVGATFGALYGSVLNVSGLLLAALVSFFVAKLLGREFVVHITGSRLRRVERFLQRFGFWPLVQTRFLPFPAAVVDYSAALAGVPLRMFILTSFIGFLPSTVIHTYFIAELIVNEGQNRLVTGGLYLAAFVVFNFVIGWSWVKEQLKRRKRYQQLRQLRAERHQNDADTIEIVRT